MTKPTRDNNGRFTGSVGNGRNNVPTPSDIPTPQHPDADPTPPDNTRTPAQQAADDANAHYRAYRAEMAQRRAQANQSWYDTHEAVRNPNTTPTTPPAAPAHPVNPDGTPMTPDQAWTRYQAINEQLDRIQHRTNRRNRNINYHPNTYDAQAAWAREDRAIKQLWAEQDALRPYLPDPCPYCDRIGCDTMCDIDLND